MQPLHCCVHQIMRSPETATVTAPTPSPHPQTGRADRTLALPLIILSFKPALRKHIYTDTHTFTHPRVRIQMVKCSANITNLFTVLGVWYNELLLQLVEWPHVLSLRYVRQHCYKGLTQRDVTFSCNNEPSAVTQLFHSFEKWDFFSLSMTWLLSWSLNLLK